MIQPTQKSVHLVGGNSGDVLERFMEFTLNHPEIEGYDWAIKSEGGVERIVIVKDGVEAELPEE